MWSAIRWLVLRLAAIRWLFKLGWLGALIPIALLLKSVGLPILGILGIVAIPAIILLFLFGLPIFLVFIFGGLFVGLLAMGLVLGLVALKFFIFVVLPLWLVWKLAKTVWCWTFKGGGPKPDSGTTTPPSSSTPGPDVA
jgi:hypothetical protein